MGHKTAVGLARLLRAQRLERPSKVDVKQLHFLIIFSVVLSALAQIALKAGVNSASIEQGLARGLPDLLLDLVSSPFVLFGLFLYFGSAAVWLIVLSKVDVSFAYPFVALGIVLTALLGRMFFGDPFNAAKLLGTFLIVAGVAVLAKA
jgi:multidrug transporter EmrE-like cation transporter